MTDSLDKPKLIVLVDETGRKYVRQFTVQQLTVWLEINPTHKVAT